MLNNVQKKYWYYRYFFNINTRYFIQYRNSLILPEIKKFCLHPTIADSIMNTKSDWYSCM